MIQNSSVSRTRGILAVRAEGERRGVAVAIDEIAEDIRDFRARYDGRMKDLEAAVDQANIKIAAGEMGAGLPERNAPVDAAYTANFRDYLRSGDAEQEIRAANREGRFATIHASLNVGTPSEGGYLAPIEWDRSIIKSLLPLSPMRRLATVRQTGVRGYSTLWNERGWGSGWVGETAARPETLAATMEPITFDNGEIYAMPAATQQILEDSEIDMGEWIAAEIAEEFATQENIAFIAGNGTNKPKGLLTYAAGAANAAAHPGGALDTVTVASATAIAADELVDFFYGLGARYRQNSTWLMNSTSAATIAKLKDGDGNYLWRESFAAGQPQTLLGRPVEFDENMPAIAAGAVPIAFGDFRSGYVINDRLGVTILRDPYTAKPYVLFYARKRVGGGVRDPRAIRVMKMAAV